MNSPRPESAPAAPSRFSAAAAALADALLPGLGQAIAGQGERAVRRLTPILLLVAVAALILVTSPSPAFLAGQLLQPPVLLGLLVLDLLVLAYRLAMAASTWRGLRPHTHRGRAWLALVLILGLVVGPQLGAAALLWDTYDTVNTVFSAAPDLGLSGPVGSAEPLPTDLPTLPPSPSAAASALPTATPTPTPVPTPLTSWAARGRLNLLLVGADAGPGRWSLRSDTMILLSVEVATGRAAMFGLPRNLVNVPLPAQWAHLWPCGCYPDLLNSLYVFAESQPAAFGGGANVGFRALEATVANFVGVPIDGTAMVTLNGFVKLVDGLGGLNINIPAALYDNQYPDESGRGDITISFAPGPQHLSGHLALAYARSRHKDSDYGRMVRQQLVLRALRSQMNPCTLIPRIPDLLALAKANSWTDLPISQLPDLLALAARTDSRHIASLTFAPPQYSEFVNPAETAAIQKVVADVFRVPAPSASPTPASASASPGSEPTIGNSPSLVPETAPGC